MLVQIYHPQSLSPARLDRYLASGWFRNASLLFRSQLGCLEGDIFSVVNIRVKLQDYAFKKRFRKLMRKNDERFRVEIGPARVDSEKERLYEAQKPRFQGFVFETLEGFFYAESHTDVFDTQEVRVYDGQRLVAVSFFDQGRQSMASLLGLYAPEYASASLGLYTMLCEVRYGIQTGRRFYYPGYVIDRPSMFDYKLRLGQLEYYNWSGRWKPIDKLKDEEMLSERLKAKINAVGAALEGLGVPYRTLLYPLFPAGYLDFSGDYVKSTLIVSVGHRDRAERLLLIEYVLEEEMYQVAETSQMATAGIDSNDARLPKEFLDRERYCPDLLFYRKVFYRGEDPFEVALQAMKRQATFDYYPEGYEDEEDSASDFSDDWDEDTGSPDRW